MNLHVRLAFIFVIAVATIATGQPQRGAVTGEGEPLTADQIATVIGSDADARAVMTMFLRETFSPGDAPRMEFLLRRQMRDEWLATLRGVEIVQLSDAEAAARLKTCATYTVISVVKQRDGIVRVLRRSKCTASAPGVDFAVRDGQWRVVGRGIGSGWLGIPADCVHCVKP